MATICIVPAMTVSIIWYCFEFYRNTIGMIFHYDLSYSIILINIQMLTAIWKGFIYTISRYNQALYGWCFYNSLPAKFIYTWSFLFSQMIELLLSFPDTLSAVTSSSSGFNFRWSTPYFRFNVRLLWYRCYLTFFPLISSYTRNPFTHQLPMTSSKII